jgi:hypothetical protein
MSFTIEHESLISQIVEIELEMFRTVNSTVHSPCQDYLNTFKTMRWMHHSVLPQAVLESYLEDLRLAKVTCPGKTGPGPMLGVLRPQEVFHGQEEARS